MADYYCGGGGGSFFRGFLLGGVAGFGGSEKDRKVPMGMKIVVTITLSFSEVGGGGKGAERLCRRSWWGLGEGGSVRRGATHWTSGTPLAGTALQWAGRYKAEN
ncbi:hypothetical protein BDZ91DRAFT_763893 [Kalaharituber pfeilii]|nr:hypothetical protein BDZ91DRAFT_763893 [Kalaharituber pfeilii]